jgi:hypothetical protein
MIMHLIGTSPLVLSHINMIGQTPFRLEIGNGGYATINKWNNALLLISREGGGDEFLICAYQDLTPWPPLL